MTTPIRPARSLTALTALLFAATLAACSSAPAGLAPGLTARMDAPNAALDQQAAFNLINDYRASRGAAPLVRDAELAGTAASLAQSYAATGSTPAKPAGTGGMLSSAGYATFADTFSGWRGTTRDANALADTSVTRAGLAVAYAGASGFGTHWVLVMAE